MKTDSKQNAGNQRLSLRQLRQWQALGFGMFIHVGMSTFDGQELSNGKQPSAPYCFDQLDVDNGSASPVTPCADSVKTSTGSNYDHAPSHS